MDVSFFEGTFLCGLEGKPQGRTRFIFFGGSFKRRDCLSRWYTVSGEIVYKHACPTKVLYWGLPVFQV